VTKPVEHYLITVYAGPHQHLHCYLITNDKRLCLKAADKMINIIKEAGGEPQLNVVLQTTLGDGVTLVHQCLRELFNDAWDTYQRARDYHLTSLH